MYMRCNAASLFSASRCAHSASFCRSALSNLSRANATFSTTRSRSALISFGIELAAAKQKRKTPMLRERWTIGTAKVELTPQAIECSRHGFNVSSRTTSLLRAGRPERYARPASPWPWTEASSTQMLICGMNPVSLVAATTSSDPVLFGKRIAVTRMWPPWTAASRTLW
jgi:hypothetical protein